MKKVYGEDLSKEGKTLFNKYTLKQGVEDLENAMKDLIDIGGIKLTEGDNMALADADADNPPEDAEGGGEEKAAEGEENKKDDGGKLPTNDPYGDLDLSGIIGPAKLPELLIAMTNKY